jgi:hypothetical protein
MEHQKLSSIMHKQKWNMKDIYIYSCTLPQLRLMRFSWVPLRLDLALASSYPSSHSSSLLSLIQPAIMRGKDEVEFFIKIIIIFLSLRERVEERAIESCGDK